MRSDWIPVKTSAGHREIVRHELPLPWRARAMLVAICGELTVMEMRNRFPDVSDVDDMLAKLLALGLIECMQRAVEEEGSDQTPESLARMLMAENVREHGGVQGALLALRMRGCRTSGQLLALLPSYFAMLSSSGDEADAIKQAERVSRLLLTTS